MVKKIEISLDEVKRLFEFLENVHDWMHQPLHYQNSEFIEKFVRVVEKLILCPFLLR
ncbi:hypothetical protein LEP1GSC133_5083 [Leptospira borgpetersenii serovar Pomona str. 200901868]|uniref:Uncharacterized protein n=2 Tax=Leptospira TaxID=171 RepID=A0AA87SY91_9LEPT|nr:hypothetical protein LEP1GSC125_0757 [Leptospira mayottensis 200901122]EMO60568.1 hypothetical protein LEP1GSC133_5083 [Leptospira borgpetersenii serovar Pomona str. 200901868]